MILLSQEMLEAAGEEEREAAAQMAEEFLAEDLPDAVFTAPKPGAGMWSSGVRLLDPIQVSKLIMSREGRLLCCMMFGLHKEVSSAVFSLYFSKLSVVLMLRQ